MSDLLPPAAPVGVTAAPTDRLLRFWLRRSWRGFLPWHRLHVRLTGRTTIRARASSGAWFELPPFDYIPAQVLRAGFYESEVFDALRPHLRPGAVFWDIGANFGLHAVSARLACAGTTVVAFEPNPAMAAAVAGNARLNHVEIIVSPLALAAATESRTLHVIRAGNPGMSTLVPWSAATYDATVAVDGARADELVASGRIPSPTVVKLDVEGGEADVFTGFGAILSAPSLAAIVFEGDSGLDASASAHPVTRCLVEAGFTLRPLLRREPTAHPLTNYLAARD